MSDTRDIKLSNLQGVKHRGADKTARIPIKIVPLQEKLKKPSWIRAKLPTGSKFFEIKNILQQVISEEDKKKPLPDDQLAEILKEKGYPIARRTIAKYREQLDIPVARLRKKI